MTSPATLHPKAQEALEEFLSLVQERFTGTFVLEFTEGVPTLRKRTDTRRYGKARRSCTLDAQSKPE